jgi:hypothetical protein
MKHSIKFLLIASMLFSFKGFSQEVPKGLELLEIMKVSETYRQAPDVSFDMSFTYTDSITPNTILEQLQGSYKIHNGKYWGMIDSIEYLQGNQYNLAIYHKDSMITVNNRQEQTTVLQIPVMDSLFREANVANMQVTRLNDSTRSLKIVFNPESPYRSYEMQYDLNNFLIRKVKYYLQDNDMGADNPGSSGVICITISFSNYSDTVVSEEYFNESKFVYRQGSELQLRPAYSGFRLINTTNNQ